MDLQVLHLLNLCNQMDMDCTICLAMFGSGAVIGDYNYYATVKILKSQAIDPDEPYAPKHFCAAVHFCATIVIAVVTV